MTVWKSLPRPPEMEPDRKLPEAGAIVLGTKGGIMYGSHGAGGRADIPREENDGIQAAPQAPAAREGTSIRIGSTAIRTGKKAGSEFCLWRPADRDGAGGRDRDEITGQELNGMAGPSSRMKMPMR